MTAKELLLVSWLAYIDLPTFYISLLARGGTAPVAAFADTVLRMDARGELCRSINDAARNAAKELLNSEYVIKGYINDNADTGFAAYVLTGKGETVVAMRGSESTGDCADSNVDWIDNVCEPFASSVQKDAVEALAKRYGAGGVTFTGHSKGGHNALAALAYSENADARAVAFNGQGFARDALTPAQEDALKARGVNYVVSDDIVGALLAHPERRIFAKGAEGVNPHMPEAYVFDETGEPVRARRSAASYAVEAGTRLAERKLKLLAGGRITEICRRGLAKYSKR